MLDIDYRERSFGSERNNRLLARLLADVRQQSHETGALDGGGHGVLAGSCATAFSSTNDPPLAVDHLLQ